MSTINGLPAHVLLGPRRPATVQVYRIGESGARAGWSGVATAPVRAGK